ARRRPEVTRLGDPAERPFRRRFFSDAVEVGTGLAEIAEAPVADLMAGVAAVELDHVRRARDLRPAFDAHLARVALQAAGFVMLARVHRCFIEWIRRVAPVALFHVALGREEAERPHRGGFPSL